MGRGEKKFWAQTTPKTLPHFYVGFLKYVSKKLFFTITYVLCSIYVHFMSAKMSVRLIISQTCKNASAIWMVLSTWVCISTDPDSLRVNKILALLVLAGVSLIFGITSLVVIASKNTGNKISTGLWGTFFTWPAGILGICGARNVPNQTALLTAHMTLVRYIVFDPLLSHRRVRLSRELKY